jgi:hypothetical protein
VRDALAHSASQPPLAASDVSFGDTNFSDIQRAQQRIQDVGK